MKSMTIPSGRFPGSPEEKPEEKTDEKPAERPDVPPSPMPLPQDLSAAVEAFSKITGLCVTLYAPDCQVVFELNAGSKVCSLLPLYNREDTPCRKNIRLAVNIVSTLGEPYYFACPAGFIQIAVPYVKNNACAGCLIAGPVIMERDEAAILTQILSLNQAPDSGRSAEWHAAVFAAVKKIPAFSAKEVASLATLLYQCAFPLPEIRRFPAPSPEALSSSCSGGAPEARADLAADEKELLRHIASGNIEKAQVSMTAYLNQLLILENGRVDACKNHLAGLCVLVSRNGGSETAMLDSFEFIHSLDRVSTISELKSWTSPFIRHFTTEKLSQIYSGDSQIVSQLISLILSDEYCSLSLAEAAERLYVNPSWLSTHFKKETGLSFTSFVTDRKIRKAQTLLTTTNLRLIEISMQCGFEEQSYFTRVFRRSTGMTPKQYRSRFAAP